MADQPTTEQSTTEQSTTEQSTTEQSTTEQLINEQETPQPVTRSKYRGRHDTDVTSLVFGLLFVGGAGMWALAQADVVSWPDASRIFPVLLVLAGLVGLVSSVRRSRGRSDQLNR